MAITVISDWLRSRGAFSLGVDLLKQYGHPSGALLFLLNTGETSESRKQLTEQLSLLDRGSSRSVPQPTARPSPAAVRTPRELAFYRANTSDGGRGDPAGLPKELQSLRTELLSLHRHESFFRGQLTVLPSGEQLTIVANKVVEIYNRKKAGWLRIEHWRATGEILAERIEPPKDGAALILERNSLRVQLSKVKHGRTRSDPERDAQRQRRLKEIETKLNEHAPPVE